MQQPFFNYLHFRKTGMNTIEKLRLRWLGLLLKDQR
jgi:hypothetical protein